MMKKESPRSHQGPRVKRLRKRAQPQSEIQVRGRWFHPAEGATDSRLARLPSAGPQSPLGGPQAWVRRILRP